jgi:CRISPR/Cas system CMR-associated protein Cmr5 small subunit
MKEIKMSNLDAMINKVGFEIVEEIKKKGKDKTKYKNYIDKALGVLANDGVYAYWVYCKANKITDVFINKLEVLANQLRLQKNNKEIKLIFKGNPSEKFFETLSEDIYQLLFFKEMVEKALIYARYHAKAMKDE